MPLKKKHIGLKVETLILVAVWEKPFIFQGCIKIRTLHKDQELSYFFRCQSKQHAQNDILNNGFSSDDYEFTHLYHDVAFVPLDFRTPEQDYALDMLKYALHVSLREMLSSRKLHFTSMDAIAMQAMIDKIKPILNKRLPLALSPEEPLGFAVAMDFSPQETMGHLAVEVLLNKFNAINPTN